MLHAKKVLLLFSGGRDSFLSTCILAEEGYKIDLVTFENGIGLQPENAEHGAKRLIEKYGENKISFLGIKNISSIWREFFLPYFNLKPTEIINEYGELPISQFHCMTCRMSMYIWCIIKLKQEKINLIADGGREDQKFLIELPSFIKILKKFLQQYEIDILLPVFNLDSKQKTKNKLLLRGFVPKVLEPQCLIGVPLPNGRTLDKEIQDAGIRFFNKVILPKAQEIISENEKAYIDGTGHII